MATKKPAAEKAPAKKKPAEPAGERFEGFADTELRYLKKLAKNQDREWFAAHKDELERGWLTPMRLLLEEVREAIDGAYPDVELAEPKIFRLHRDVRFSADKTPYKTHVAGVILASKGRAVMDSPAAIYLHLGLDETMAAGGQYMMEKEALARFRAAVLDEAKGKELAGLLAKLEKKGHRFHAGETLKNVPKGVDPGHPRAEILKRKGLVSGPAEVPLDKIASRALVPWITGVAKDLAPLVRWLAYAVG